MDIISSLRQGIADYVNHKIDYGQFREWFVEQYAKLAKPNSGSPELNLCRAVEWELADFSDGMVSEQVLRAALSGILERRATGTTKDDVNFAYAISAPLGAWVSSPGNTTSNPSGDDEAEVAPLTYAAAVSTQVATAPADMTQEEVEGIIQGLRDVAAGRTRSLEEIKRELGNPAASPAKELDGLTWCAYCEGFTDNCGHAKPSVSPAIPGEPPTNAEVVHLLIEQKLPDKWIAHCLELDLAAVMPTKWDAVEELALLINRQIEFGRRNGREDAIPFRAPQEYFNKLPCARPAELEHAAKMLVIEINRWILDYSDELAELDCVTNLRVLQHWRDAVTAALSRTSGEPGK